MRKRLNIIQRLIVVGLFIIVFFVLCWHFDGDIRFFLNPQNRYALLFTSCALMLIMGTYIAEPFFASPTEVLANSIAIVLFLLSFYQERHKFVGFNYIIVVSFILIILSLVAIFLNHKQRNSKFSKILFSVLTKIGNAKMSYSIIYLATLISFFRDSQTEFILFLTFWLIFIFKILIEDLVIWFTQLINIGKEKSSSYLGEITSIVNPLLIKVETEVESNLKIGDFVSINKSKYLALGMIVEIQKMLGKRWLLVHLLQDSHSALLIDKENHSIIETPLESKSSIQQTKDYSVELFNLQESKNTRLIDELKNCNLYKKVKNLIGYVTSGSDINTIKIRLLETKNLLTEGDIVLSQIYNENVMYQILDGETAYERVDENAHSGYQVAIAKKIGVYKEEERELQEVEWLPETFTPVYRIDKPLNNNKDVDKRIGILPNTNFEIDLKDINSLVTHNTAILGILGIGKSCLTFEILKKITKETDCKIICVDLTGQYEKELPLYLDSDNLTIDISIDSKNKLNETKKQVGDKNIVEDWGNVKQYKKELTKNIGEFQKDEKKRVLILNPDKHNVTKAATSFNIGELTELTPAQKTRAIAEIVFIQAQEQWKHLETKEQDQNIAKILLVFEEAHALIPEWNSIAEDGDKNAVNGTAKIILQGRKYGLGSLVVTQRTANVSKSILNQCNTIFALRVFDDTGKDFLSNYFGTDYANALTSLEERTAVVFGKALKLKQPVIINLNDRDDIRNNNP